MNGFARAVLISPHTEANFIGYGSVWQYAEGEGSPETTYRFSDELLLLFISLEIFSILQALFLTCSHFTSDKHGLVISLKPVLSQPVLNIRGLIQDNGP